MKRGDPIEFHDRLADDYLDNFSDPSDNLEKFVDKMPDSGRVLDAGCGAGVDSEYLNSQGFDVIAVDLAEEMLRVGRENFGEVEFQRKDLRDLDFQPSSFDGVVASFSLIYLPKSDVPGVVRNFKELLKNGGLLFLGLQKGKSRETRVQDPAVEGEIFMNVMSEDEIGQILEEDGFSIIEKFERSPKSEMEFDFQKLYIIAELS